jgi:F-type H+-transporting ATPase subunit gamma
MRSKSQMPNVMNQVDFDLAVDVARIGLNAFLAGEVQEVYMIYCRFRSMAPWFPRLSGFCPSRRNRPRMRGPGPASEYLTEPSAEEILVDLLPRYLNVQVYQGLLETHQ